MIYVYNYSRTCYFFAYATSLSSLLYSRADLSADNSGPKALWLCKLALERCASISPSPIYDAILQGLSNAYMQHNIADVNSKLEALSRRLNDVNTRDLQDQAEVAKLEAEEAALTTQLSDIERNIPADIDPWDVDEYRAALIKRGDTRWALRQFRMMARDREERVTQLNAEYTQLRSPYYLAMAMSSHPRLGDASPMHMLSSDNLNLIHRYF